MRKLFLPVLILAVCLTYGCSKTGSTELSGDSESSSSDELKKKELELKERELSIKEKEWEKVEMQKKRISEDEARKFIDNWMSYQNNKALGGYSSLYSREFKGIKRSASGKASNYGYDEWVADRSKMYKSTNYLYVNAIDLKMIGFDENSGQTKINFTQYFTSDTYSDEGLKVMRLTRDDSGDIKIVYEEMVYSNDMSYEEGC